MRRLFVFFLVLLGLAVGGDFLLRGWAERRAAGHVQERLELDQEPTVSLGGWPFLFSALDGHFPDVGVETGPIAAEGVRLDDVQLRFRDVEISFGDAVGGGTESVRTSGGRGEAFIGAAAITEGFNDQGVPAEVSFEGGKVLVSSPQLPEPVEGQLDLRGRRLILSARGAPERFAVRLPVPVEGLEYRTVVVRDDRAVLRFNLAPGRLRPPQ